MTDENFFQAAGPAMCHLAQRFLLILRESVRKAGPIAVICLATACVSTHVKIGAYQSEPLNPETKQLRAGAAMREITPLPGYPMGGHSLGGRYSRGRWLPLYARAFYFQDAEGHSVGLVSCDLFAIPGGLQQKVAYLVNQRSSDMSLDNLIIAATHTHQGPGNYLTSSFYNSFASPFPGFAPELFDQLAEQISGALVEAIASSKAPGSVELTLTQVDVRSLVADPASGVRQFARNRAIRPLLRQAASGQSAACDLLSLPQGDCRCAPLGENCDLDFVRANAFNPELLVLTLARTSGGARRRLGQLVFFGVHPTTMSDHTQVYSSDFIGLAMRTIEKTSADQPFISGFFNGADGDVSPNWGRQDAEDTRELAASFVNAVGHATSPVLTVGDDARVFARRTSRERADFCEKNRPMMGVATVGGGDDGRFVSFDLGWRAPARKSALKNQSFLSRLGPWRLWNRRSQQEPKQPGLDVSGNDLISLTELLAPPADYPTQVPVSVVRIGMIQFLAAPFELTSVTGMELKRSLAGSPPQSTILLGLANEYLSYIATESEYQDQEYEGASTLYGPHSAHCLADLLRTIQEPLTSPSAQTHPATDLDVYHGARFGNVVLGPEFWGWNAWYSDESLESPFVDTVLPARWPRLEWSGPEPGRVAIWVGDGEWRLLEDDDDSYVLVELVDGEHPKWNAVWLRADPTDERLAVIAVSSRGQRLCSEPFSLAEIANGGRPSTIPTGNGCPF